MMKRLVAFLITCLFAYTVVAAPIKRSEARRKVSAFMAERGWTVASADGYRPLKTGAQSDATADDGYQPLYVFNAENAKGFVIVSGDDCTESVLGYCEDASFDEGNIPPAMQWWMENAIRQIEYAGGHNLHTGAEPHYKEAIAPLMHSRWGQDAPYNGYCPVISGSHAPTGCVATAMAQIMYYYKWPVSETEEIPEYTTNTLGISLPSLPPTVLDWEKIKSEYYPTDTDVEEIDKLMQYVGQAAKTNYTQSGAGARFSAAVDALVNLFHYAPTAQIIYRYGQTISKWEEIVYNEIANNRPVLYSGETLTTNYGHAFVCDGYDGNGLYHINWGWNGSYNGYFRLSVLNPYSTSPGNSTSSDEGYSEFQYIIAGLNPEPAGNVIQPDIPLSDFRCTESQVEWFVHPIASGIYEVALASIDEEGMVESVYDSTLDTLDTDFIYSYYVEYSLLPDGKHRYAPVMREQDSAQWVRIGNVSVYAIITKNGDSVACEVHPNGKLSVHNVNFLTSASTTTARPLGFYVACEDDEFNGTIYVFASGNGVKPMESSASMSFYALPGDTVWTTLRVKVPTTDNLHLWFATDEGGTKIIGERQFLMYDVDVASSSIAYDPLSVTVTFHNSSECEYKGIIHAVLSHTKKSEIYGTYDRNVTIPANGDVTLEYRPSQLSATATYFLKFQYNRNELTNKLYDMSGRVNINFAADGIETVTLDAENPASAFNLAGQRVGDGYKGVVVRNGKKVAK